LPRRAPYLVHWLVDRQAYRVDGDATRVALTPGRDAWFDWLDGIVSFAFHSRSGAHCTIRKETLRRGGAYWYGYRSRRGRTVKRYIGRTADLSVARLEEMADRLADATLIDADAVPRPSGPIDTGPVRAASPDPSSPVAAPAAMPLLASKLHPPRLPGSLVARERLLDRLDTGLSRKLTLLTAPAGFGKTTLMGQWIADRAAPAGIPVAWVSLDAGDDDPVRFWRYVITACQAIHRGAGQAALAQLAAALQPPFEPLPLETVLTFFLNDVTTGARDGLLVLEDYHVVTTPRIHETLAFVVDHLPPTLRLVMLTRTEPPLPLPRWRARGDLHEMQAADLRFSREETATFLRQALPYALSETAVAQLDARLEGWAAGLRLLALSMQGPLTPREVERHLAGLGDTQGPAQPHRPILDYFVTEVLHAQSEPLQLFLLQTSMLSRLSGPLCDSVTGRSDSAALLDVMERAGLFLEALDESSPWYRYHALFAEAMRAVARQRLGDDALRALSMHASHWYERHDLLADAIDAALYAGEAERAAALIERLTDTGNVHFHELHTLRRWLEQVPDEVRRAHPGLCLAYALALLITQYPHPATPPVMARVDEALRMADDGWRGQGDLARLSEVWAFRAMLAWWEGRVEHAARDARQSLAWLPDDETAPRDGATPRDGAASPARGVWEWRAVNLAILGSDALQAGRVEEARRLFQEARRRSVTVGSRPFGRITTLLLGTACIELGELRQAEVYYRQVLPDAKEQEDREDIAFALLALAELSYEWNDLDAVDRLLDDARGLGDVPRFSDIGEHTAFRQALLHHARGDDTAALRQVASILARLHAVASPRARQAIPNVLIWQGRLSLAAGDLVAARRSLDTLQQMDEDVSPVQRAMGQVLAARVLLARGKAQDALSHLERLLIVAREQRQARHALEIEALMALALAARGQGSAARQRLRLVLEQACGEGFMRLFLDEGEPLAALLRALLPSVRAPALRSYARAILQASTTPRAPAPAASDAAPAEPLSLQERRVLRLLAAGRSNPEIAEELFVSVNTAKGHVKSIYRKLDVRNRLEASEAARGLTLP